MTDGNTFNSTGNVHTYNVTLRPWKSNKYYIF